MEIIFKSQLDPELDCYYLLCRRYRNWPQLLSVRDDIQEVAEEGNIPREALEQLLAPVLAVEEHILSHLSTPEQTLRYFFPRGDESVVDSQISLMFFFLRRNGIRFRELEGEALMRAKSNLIYAISYPDGSHDLPLTDYGALLSMLDEAACPDHTLRVCLDIFRDPVPLQEAFDALLEEAAALYREKMDLLPPVTPEDIEYAKTMFSFQDDTFSFRNVIYSQPDTLICQPAYFKALYALTFFFADDPNLPKEFLVVYGPTDRQIAKLIQQGSPSLPLLAQKLKLLADPRRLELLSALREGPQYVSDLTERLDISPALLSHHLNLLISQKLISLQRSGCRNRYELNQEQLDQLIQELKKLVTPKDGPTFGE